MQLETDNIHYAQIFSRIDTLPESSTALNHPPASPLSKLPTVNRPPLIKANLLLLEGPPEASEIPPRGSNMMSSLAAESLEESSTSKSPDARHVRRSLEAYGCLINDRVARNLHFGFLQQVKELTFGQKGPEISPEEQEIILEIRDNNALENEDTFLYNFWPVLLSPSIKKVFRSGHEIWIPKGSFVKRCGHKRNQLFRRGSMPDVSVNDVVHKMLLTKMAALATPKPNIIYGIKRSGFTEPEMRINVLFSDETDLTESGLYHSFLVIECAKDGIEEAKNQACRSGATLVAATRRLYQKSHLNPSNPGADYNSHIFSLAITSTLAQLFVDWAGDNGDGKVIYHMHRLAGYELEDGPAVGRLNHDLKAVVYWGTVTRMESLIMPMLNAVYERVLEVSAAARGQND